MTGISLLVLIGCSLVGSAGLDEIPISLDIGELPHELGAGLSFTPLAKTLSLAPSSDNYAWSTVDGFKITLLKIYVMDSNGDYAVVADFGSEGEVLEIGNDYSGSITVDGTIPEGEYVSYGMELKGEYDIKAYAYTATKTVYTTASGVVAVDGQVDPSSFTNYDYYHYDFLYVTTAEGPTDTDDTGYEGWYLETPVTIDSSTSEVNFQLLIDTYNLVTAWDGTGFRPGISPFSWTNNNGYNVSDFFPDATPNIGISYIPMYLSINDPGTSIGEVYIISKTEADVSDFDPATDDMTGLQYIVFVFNSLDQYVGSRVVGFDNGELYQFQS